MPLFSEYLFQPFSRQNLLYTKAGIKCNVQQWREEAVQWVGPRERAAETFQRKPSKEYVVCSFGLFVGLMWQHEKRLVVSELFCQDKELHEKCLCFLLNWHQKQWRANHRLPKLSSLRGEIEVLFGHFVVTDPFTLMQRLSESLLNNAISLMVKERGKQKRAPTGVTMFGFGNFDLYGVGILRKFCSVATTKRKLISEQQCCFCSN